MSEEDREILARISQIAGQINRRRNQQAAHATGATAVANHHPAHHRYNAYRGRGYGHAYRVGRPMVPHRNRSLVLNGATPPQAPVAAVAAAATAAAAVSDSSANESSASSPSWVSRTDRHLQLINSDIYEKDSQARAKAIEETRQQKLRAHDAYEKSKIANHLSRQANRATAAPNPAGTMYEIQVDGIPFHVTKNGSKLVKVPGYISSGNPTPKTAIVGGVKFYRSKNGNLYRGGIIKAQRQSGTVKKINETCKIFSSTGSCPKGPGCRYVHDPTRVGLCKDFLKGTCPNGDHCDLSHEPTAQRTPACLHFARGNCTNPNCIYAHSKVPAGAPVCRAFGLYSYCDKGVDCEERHVFECPDFSNTGKCKTKGCKLLHRERASVLRKTQSAVTIRAEGDSDDDNMDDVSSDDEPVDSDDVDSDEVEEFISGDADDTDFRDQRDFIAF